MEMKIKLQICESIPNNFVIDKLHFHMLPYN